MGFARTFLLTLATRLCAQSARVVRSGLHLNEIVAATYSIGSGDAMVVLAEVTKKSVAVYATGINKEALDDISEGVLGQGVRDRYASLSVAGAYLMGMFGRLGAGVTMMDDLVQKYKMKRPSSVVSDISQFEQDAKSTCNLLEGMVNPPKWSSGADAYKERLMKLIRLGRRAGSICNADFCKVQAQMYGMGYAAVLIQAGLYAKTLGLSSEGDQSITTANDLIRDLATDYAALVEADGVLKTLFKPSMQSECLWATLWNMPSSCRDPSVDLQLRKIPLTNPTQPNTWGGSAFANLAIDGNTDGEWSSGSCAATWEMDNPWWEAEIPKGWFPTQLRLWNRQDCCPNRLDNVDVKIGGKSIYLVTNPPAGALSPIDFSTPFTHEQTKLRLQSNIRTKFTICEVEVWGYTA